MNQILKHETMKIRDLFVLCMIITVPGCSTKKKVSEITETATVLTESSENVFSASEKIVDTTVTEWGRITVTEVSLPPTPSEGGGVDLHGYIKFRQITIERASEKKGESREISSSNVEKHETAAANIEKTEKVNITPVPSPNRMRYLFYILILTVVIWLYIKRKPIWKRVKTIFSASWV